MRECQVLKRSVREGGLRGVLLSPPPLPWGTAGTLGEFPRPVGGIEKLRHFLLTFNAAALA